MIFLIIHNLVWYSHGSIIKKSTQAIIHHNTPKQAVIGIKRFIISYHSALKTIFRFVYWTAVPDNMNFYPSLFLQYQLLNFRELFITHLVRLYFVAISYGHWLPRKRFSSRYREQEESIGSHNRLVNDHGMDLVFLVLDFSESRH